MSQRVSLPFATLSRSTLRTSPISSPLLALRRAFHHPKLRRSPPPGSFVATRVAPRNAEWARNLATVGLGSGVGFLVYQAFAGRDGGSPFREASCESAVVATPPPPSSDESPQSILSVYQLSFGAVCGICTGVFIKKGLKAIAFLLGGAFVLLQYLSSKSFISVDWKRISGKYDNLFGTKTATGDRPRPPTAQGLYNWFVDFLTANFQQRATFIAGIALGLRLG